MPELKNEFQSAEESRPERAEVYVSSRCNLEPNHLGEPNSTEYLHDTQYKCCNDRSTNATVFTGESTQGAAAEENRDDARDGNES